MKKINLQNGVRVVTEKIPHFRSLSIGVWVRAGSLYEMPDNNGISHFIEHMLFKGTKNRSAMEIAAAIDAIGGQLNAFTSKECTCYYVHVLDAHADLGVELLADMLKNSRLSPAEIKKEQGVVCEEISMVADTPDELANELASKAFFGSHPLARPILGTRKNVQGFTGKKLREYMACRYKPEDIVLSVAGNFSEKELLAQLEEHFGTYQVQNGQSAGNELPVFMGPKKKIITRNKDNEQMNMCLNFSGTSITEEDYFPMVVMNAAFGGSMSSRLFQRIREQNGLTYSVYSYPSAYTDTGEYCIYAGMNPTQTRRVYDLVLEEIAQLTARGLREKELLDSKEQVKGSMMLGLESAKNIMTRNGRNTILNNHVRPVDEVLAAVDAVQNEDILRVAGRIFKMDTLCGAFVGKEQFFPKL